MTRPPDDEATTKRDAILRRVPSDVGGAWVRSLCSVLAEQGRPVAGGWPGTIVEARALIGYHLRLELEGRGMRGASTEEMALAADATYASARLTWLGLERNARMSLRRRPQ